MKIATCCVGTALVMLGSIAFAQAVYRSTDESGQVTYSDTPPSPGTDAQLVDLPPPPSQQRVDEARQRVEQEQKISKEFEQSRQQLEDRRRAERERQARQAERQATTAPRPRDGDYPYALPPGPGLPEVPIEVPLPGDHPAYRPGPAATPLPSGIGAGGL